MSPVTSPNLQKADIDTNVRLRDNERAYDKFKIRQRILVDVASVDTTTTIFGSEVSLPLAFAPSAMHGLAHPDGEKATSRAAAARNIPMGLSTYATTSLEDVIQERGSSANPYVFQLSIPKDRSVPLGLIKRAEGRNNTYPWLNMSLNKLTSCWLQGVGTYRRCSRSWASSQ